ncbi:MAG: tetratricopeptide repeat protein [Deltaproteobacteria bacterium]
MDEKSKIIDKAQKLLQKGYLDKAIAEYKKVVEKYPKDTTIRLRVGDLYVKVGKKDEAIKEYGEVAKIHTKGGFNLKAIAVYKQILKLDEGQMDIYFKLSDLYTNQRLIADAVASLSVLVNFYEKKGKADEAIDVLKKMITVDPQNVGVRLKLADYYKTKGFINDALAEYVVAFNSLLKDGKIDKAEKLYEGLYADNRKNINIIEGLAEVYRVKGANIKFIRYCKELANLYKEKGEAEKRKEIYKKILEIAPEDNDALNALGIKPAVESPAQKPAPSKVPAEDKTAKEPLIAWPEFTKDLFEEPREKPEQIAAPAPLKEEPLISWDEMIEITEEVGERATPSEPETSVKQPVEEAPIIEMPEIQAAEITEEEPLIEMPEVHAAETKEDAQLIPPIPSEEKARAEEVAKEIAPEYIEPEEKLPQVEEAEVLEAVEEAAPKHGLEGFGLEGFLPEGATIIGEMESQPDEEGYVDLSSELGLEEALDFLTESWAPDEKGKETFTEFKHGVEKQLSREDTETHYNLGIAYMEMELFDDAMREFKIALKNPVFEFDCYARLGLSLRIKGDYEEAIGNFLKGLKVSGRTDEERKGIMYELGLTYEAAGNSHEALEIFTSVFEMDEWFREASYKIQELRKKLEEEIEAGAIPSTDDMIEVELL